MKSISRIIKDLPFGASALVEERINHKNTTIIIIKDKFKGFMNAPWEMEFHFKGGVVRSRKILSAHIIIEVKDNFNDKYYPFHFDYYEESSLKLLYNLTKQREIYIIVSDGSDEYISKSFNNNLGPFLKKYVKDCINYGYRWNNEEYKQSLVAVIESFQDIRDFWDRLGNEVHMEGIRK